MAELWHIDETGFAVQVVRYPLPPSDTTISPGTFALDSTGALFHIAYRGVSFNDVILRRTIEGDSDIVYDEASDPLVKVHISNLVTAP